MQKQITLTTSPQPSFGTVAAVAHPAGTTLGTKQLPPDTWSIVLGGGEGERLRVLTKRWLGAHRPKQYCAFVGNRSMLQHTLDRAVVFSGTDRTLVVVARQHAPDVWEHLDKIHWKQTILQPRNCGTGPGIFLPLAHISEDENEYLIKAELPDVRKEAVKVTAEAGILTIMGERNLAKEENGMRYHRVERAYGSFGRTFSLPDDASPDKVSAEFKDGVLTVHLKKDEKAKPQHVEVKIA